MSTSPLLDYDPPKYYPDEMKSRSYLRPTEVTFNTLKFAVNTATKNLMSNSWNEKNAIAYCGTNCINTAGCEKLMKKTKKSKHLKR